MAAVKTLAALTTAFAQVTPTESYDISAQDGRRRMNCLRIGVYCSHAKLASGARSIEILIETAIRDITKNKTTHGLVQPSTFTPILTEDSKALGVSRMIQRSFLLSSRAGATTTVKGNFLIDTMDDLVNIYARQIGASGAGPVTFEIDDGVI